MSPWLLIGILFFVFVVGLVGWCMWMIAHFKKATKDHVYCTFLMKGGGRQNLLLRESNGWVAAPKGHSFSKGLEPAYAVSEKTSYNMLYPPWGLPDLLTVTVRSGTWFEGNMEPVKEPETSPLITPEVLAAFRSAQFAAAAVGKGYEAYGGGGGAKGLKPLWLYVCLGLVAVLVLVAVVVGIMTLTGVGDLKAAWGM